MDTGLKDFFRDFGNRLDAYSARKCRQYDLPSDNADILQETKHALYRRAHSVSEGDVDILSMPPEKLFSYAKKTILNDICRRRRRRDTEMGRLRQMARDRGAWEDVELPEDGMVDPGEGKAALRAFRAVCQCLGVKGRFALLVALRLTSPEAEAARFGISPRTGRRYFNEGLPTLRKAIERVLADEFGDHAVADFAHLISFSPSLKGTMAAELHAQRHVGQPLCPKMTASRSSP